MTDLDTTLASVPQSPALSNVRLRIQPVILAGGSGTRLWPMSREHFPKQLIGLLGEQSLLQSTVQRLEGLTYGTARTEDAIVVCGEQHRFTTADQLRAQGRRAQLMLEPVARNTAPALTVAAMRAVAGGDDAILVVMPADHVVTDIEAFHRAIASGAQCAEDGAIVTLCIVPTHAETGYGYIKVGPADAQRRRMAARTLRRKAASRTCAPVRQARASTGGTRASSSCAPRPGSRPSNISSRPFMAPVSRRS